MKGKRRAERAPQSPLVPGHRPALVRPPLAGQADGLCQRRLSRQADDRHPQHLERPEYLSHPLPQRAEEVKRGVWQAGGFPVEVPAMAIAETYMKPSR